MAFPSGFLDELRSRVSLAEVVGRRVNLQKRGREYMGLCPFHKEKTPSFHVVEDKGFYHCFGCGAHGDVIGFAMQTQNLAFREAVEELAHAAGLEVPRETPQEREREQRRATLYGALTAATGHFEANLAGPRGQGARAYLEGRGLDAGAMQRFHLGYALDARDDLKRALAKDFPEPLLIEAGLIRKAEDRPETYDYFRDRVIFPISDRGGRTIAFGGRVMGDGQPKYLNSPETPVFQKGRVLYGWPAARAAAAREPSAIVTEGYMDVIALHRAGFGTAVAPLGTALTEHQLEEVWKLAPEPVLCFDGDAAGQRAATRALDRALALLKPGRSLRFAVLPEGDDPDTLIARLGTAAMRDVLTQARPLAETLWAIETANPADTPERRAALEARLETRVRQIADRAVQDHYRRFFRECLFQAFRGPRTDDRGRKRYPSSVVRHPSSVIRSEPPPRDPGLLLRRNAEIRLALVLNHPFILNEYIEEISAYRFADRELDRLLHEILRIHALTPDLDAASLRLHLSRNGYDRVVSRLLSPQVLTHAAFARPEAGPDAAREGWLELASQILELSKSEDKAVAERDLAADMSLETWERTQPLLERKSVD
jgi:DNA primase